MNARRHECLFGMAYPHTSGDGAPKRKKCAYCGGQIAVYEGTYGVFVWTGDGRYPIASALSVHKTRKSADLAALAAGKDTVSRWIPA